MVNKREPVQSGYPQLSLYTPLLKWCFTQNQSEPDTITITVLGCGCLGFPLSQRLAGLNYRVKGSARSDKKVKLLNQNSIDWYRIELPDSFQDESAEPFWNSEILFLNIPP